MDSGHRETLLRLSLSAILELVDGIAAVVAKRTEDNEAYIDAAPDVLPHQRVRIMPATSAFFLQRHRQRLYYTFSNEEIENIVRQHKALYDSYHRQPDVKSLLTASTTVMRIVMLGLVSRTRIRS
jgi:C4-dicarboxylate-specific signal transduction histidine kinase